MDAWTKVYLSIQYRILFRIQGEVKRGRKRKETYDCLVNNRVLVGNDKHLGDVMTERKIGGTIFYNRKVTGTNMVSCFIQLPLVPPTVALKQPGKQN